MRIAIVALLLLMVSAASTLRLGAPSYLGSRSETFASTSSNCSSCQDGSSCCDDQQCCSGGKSCCPANGTCCGDECCSDTQSCCPDPKYGDVCCQAEVTFCCPPDNNPSRCCPRWMICCPIGRYGCCDPSSGLPVDDLSLYNSPPRVKSGPPAGSAVALYVNMEGTFSAMTIDMTTGKRTDTPLSTFNDWDEMTRAFAYDNTHGLFYLLQANFLNNNTDHSVILWTVDPIAGTVTNATVTGADDEGVNDVAGFEWVPSLNAILFAVEVVTGKHSDDIAGYNFYKLSPTSGAATLVSKYATSGSGDDYVGWFDGVAENGTTVYRLGYQDPTSSSNPGIGVTDISTPTATTTWFDNINVPSPLHFYSTLTVYGNDFLSLAADESGKYSLVKWDLSSNAVVVASLPDAHTTPYFGPLAEFYDAASSTYGALVVWDSLVSDLDRWDLVVFNIAVGKAAELALDPILLAKATSVSGLGF